MDCGGPCAPCELQNPSPVTVFWARAVKVRENIYDVAAHVQNPNEVLSSDNLEYEFALFDDLGEIARRIGRTFIYPQESAYVVEAGLKTLRIPTRVEFKINKVDWRFLPVEKPSLVVEKRNYGVSRENQREQSVVDADIFNRSSFGYREIEISFLVLDKNGNILGVNQTVVNNLLAGARQSVRSTWPAELKGEIGAVEVNPRVNVFKPSAMLKPSGQE